MNPKKVGYPFETTVPKGYLVIPRPHPSIYHRCICHITYACDVVLRRIVGARLPTVFALGLHGTETLGLLK